MKTLSFFTMACAVCVGFASCNSEDNYSPETSLLKLRSKIAPMTRVTDQNLQSTQIANGQQVGVTITDAKTEHVNVAWTVSEDGKMTNTGDALYWNGKDVSVTAYHPYQSDWSGESVNEVFSVSTNQSSNSAYLNSDLLWSSTTASPSATPIALTFTHKLAKINVTLVSDDIANLSNATVNICNTIIATYFNPVTGEVTASNAFAPRTIKTGVTTSSAFTAAAIVVPQTVTKGTKLIQVQHDGKDYFYTLPSDMEIESGHSYSYTLKVRLNSNLQELQCVSENITDWNNENLSGNIDEDVNTGNMTNVTLTEAGTLKSALGNQMLAVSELKIVGPLNGTDIKCLRQMAGCPEFSDLMKGNLTILDLAEATIVEGGDAYYSSLYTKNNEVGTMMFEYAKFEQIILPYNLNTIGGHAFSHCQELISVYIPNSVTTIGSYAFEVCMKLTSVSIPNSVTTIEMGVFQNCFNLTRATIGNGVTTIVDIAFYGCNKLTSVTLPNSVNTIGMNAFKSCSSLSEVICFATVPPSLGSGAFTITNTLKVPNGYKTTYESTDWKNYFTNIEELSE